MNGFLAALDQNYAWIGLVPAGMVVVGLIINVASLRGKDMNHKSGHATNLLFIALLIEAATWTVRAFGGGTPTGTFWTVVTSASVHVLSAAVALWAIWEHSTVGRWPHGRRRATWGFWLNVIALLVVAAWFYLGENPKLWKHFE